MAECLTRRGFPAKFIPDAQGGSVEWASTDEQQEAADTARQACNDELVRRGLAEAPRKPTAAELKDGYAKLVKVRRCLLEEGYDLPPAPSQEAYLASGGAWTPYAELPDVIPDDVWRRLNVACPQPV